MQLIIYLKLYFKFKTIKMDDNKENKKNIDNNKDNLNKDNITDEPEPEPLGKQVSIVH